MSMQPEAQEAWDKIKPIVDELGKYVTAQDLPDECKPTLALLITGNFLGIAAYQLRKSQPSMAKKKLSEIANEIINIVLPMIDAQENLTKN